jgi:hypothetical protein
MPNVIAKRKYEDLFQKISNTLGHWPERERKIFSMAHYRGQSLETIARSLELELKEVDAVLKQCEHGLHDSLRDFLNSGPGKSDPNTNKPAHLAVSEQDVKTAHALSSKIRKTPSRSRIPA